MREADSKSAFYRQGSWLVIVTFISGFWFRGDFYTFMLYVR